MTTARPARSTSSRCKDGRTVYIDGKLVGDVTEHPAFRNSVKSAALLYDFQARPENIELMTFTAERREPPRQSRLADAAQLRRDGAAAQGACRPGRSCPTASWAARPTISPRRCRPAHGHRGVREARRRRAPRRCEDYFEEASRNDYVPHLRDHQSAGRARQGLGRAGGGPGRAHRRRGCRRHHDPRRQDARHHARSWPTRCSSPTCSR